MPSPNGHPDVNAATTRLHSVEAEEAALGCLLIDPQSYFQVSDFLRPEHFFIVKHAWIYEAIEAVIARGDGVDLISVTEQIKQRGQLQEIGGPAYLTLLLNHTPYSLYIETYARIIERAAVRRGLLNAASQIAQLAHDGEKDLDAVIDLASASVAAAASGRHSDTLAPMTRITDDYLAQLGTAGDFRGIPTGYADIDHRLGGLQRSDLLIIAGRPGMGKTAWLHGAALHGAQQHKRVLILSMEMNKIQVLQRLIAQETGVSTDKQRTGRLTTDERDLVVEAATRLSALPIWIDDTPALTPAQLEAKAQRLYNEHGLDLLIVDYVQLMTAPGGREQNRVQEVSTITRSLKQLARALNLPILASAQLNRAVEQRQDKRPVLSDLRESGSIEMDADVVMFIYRDEVYNENTEHPNEAEINTAKHRNGPTGIDRLYFLKEQAKFGNLKLATLDLRRYGDD